LLCVGLWDPGSHSGDLMKKDMAKKRQTVENTYPANPNWKREDPDLAFAP
jgi:hypothetical protein